MGKFIHAEAFVHNICIDKEEVKGVARFENPGTEKPYGVKIYLKNQSEPEKYFFEREGLAHEFFYDILGALGESNYTRHHLRCQEEIRECLLNIENDIEKINKKLISIQKGNKNV